MEYKVIRDTKSFNKAGLNPTTKNGTEMGIVRAGFIFSDVGNQNGWLAIALNKWVKASDCELTTVTPPPPPPVDPPVDMTIFDIFEDIRVGTWDDINKMIVWGPYKTRGIKYFDLP